MRVGLHDIRRDGRRTFVVSEIGINHNGDLTLAKELIRAAHLAGADAVKFQKRTVEIVYTPEDLARPRESPFGSTNGDLKHGLEFGRREYDEIDFECRRLGLAWFASPFDVDALKFLLSYDVPAVKIASPCVTDHELLALVARTKTTPVIMSTGMSTLPEITHARSMLPNEVALLSCVSSYPAAIDDLNLSRIATLRDTFPHDVIGYSGHEVSIWTTLCAVALGARIVERHFTLDRTMWGSDHAASLEPKAFAKLVVEIRDFERALGRGVFRRLPCEQAPWEKLRRYK